MEYLTTEIALAAIAGIMGVLSTAASLRSANSANEAQHALIEQQELARRSEVAQLVANSNYEYKRIEFIVARLGAQIRHGALASGGYGGSRQNLAEETVAELMQRSVDAYKDASKFNNDASLIEHLKAEEVSFLLLKLPLMLNELRAIGDELLRESDTRSAELLQYRERALNASAPTK